jgi:hypothetical protein
MGAPLLDRHHQALGAMVIQSYTQGVTYSEEDQALFSQIANHVSNALQGLQSVDRLERAVQERTAALAIEVAERRRAEQVQHALYQIASLSAQALDTATLTTSLHGIITADALGIPNHWLRVSENVFGGDWKFLDYFSAVGRTTLAPLTLPEINQSAAALEASAAHADAARIVQCKNGLERAFKAINL